MPKVAIIERDDSVRLGLRLLLQSADFDVMAYASADEFIESRCIENCDCIVMDPDMPGHTGFDLLGRLCARGQAPPVIVVTASPTDANRVRARRLGVKAFFGKPIDDQALIDAIHWAIGRNDP